MERYDIYKDISHRTGGDIYIGVVGPVRTGKSTFITRFMEKLVLPNISNKLQKQIATDEMPQSADGKTIMTTQPKFIPANAVKVQFKNNSSAKVRLVDCVGYFVEGAVGHEEDEKPRLVKTPWEDKEIPFEKAAEIGTKKVITDYSTIGVVVTTDGREFHHRLLQRLQLYAIFHLLDILTQLVQKPCNNQPCLIKTR